MRNSCEAIETKRDFSSPSSFLLERLMQRSSAARRAVMSITMIITRSRGHADVAQLNLDGEDAAVLALPCQFQRALTRRPSGCAR